ncbi:MAG: type II toxin-antitoxin system VapC family toxin [Caldilineales bacterium]|nr:type II toxin-antitoxin system VapC family toxin [Caldilineales bacterium]MCW5858595.1 type II toxin-antitoxin system VapC family toxin [Caldilineales bacterium]
MRLLLDTHVFLWAFAHPERLHENIRSTLRSSDNVLYLSTASVWEMQIKTQIGKLDLGMPVEAFVASQRSLATIRSLPIVERHVWALQSLPAYHKDPFDRLLIAQAKVEQCLLVTVDPVFQHYPVKLLRLDEE